MTMVVRDPSLEKRIKAQRRRTGADRLDEVWEGVYMMAALADDQHQALATMLGAVFQILIGWTGLGEVRIGVNVSDRDKDWRRNYRCPDVAVFLQGTKAKNRRTHWFGGPDFAVEILSPKDRSRKKLVFYAKLGVRELLLIDRKPWALELYRLHNGELQLATRSTLEQPHMLVSEVLPVAFRLLPGEFRPTVHVTHRGDGREWSI